MKKVYSIILFLTAAVVVYFLTVNTSNTNTNQPEIIVNKKPVNTTLINTPLNNNTNTSNNYVSPLNRASERITKKEFGDYITQANSPVQPERFAGYHTGTDFEVFEDELDSDIQVKAICQGKLRAKRTASGYGGLAVQSCEINNESVTVIYGHLQLSSIGKNQGEEIKAGEIIGLLGADKSTDTDGERKHLHLGIHKGEQENIRGYAALETELIDWIDPCLYFCI